MYKNPLPSTIGESMVIIIYGVVLYPRRDETHFPRHVSDQITPGPRKHYVKTHTALINPTIK